MADVSRAVEIIFKGNNQLGSSINGVESSFGNIDRSAGEATGKIDQMGNEIDDLGTGGTASLNNLALAIKAIAASAVIKEFAQANVAIENFERGITALTGSTDDAARELEYIRDVSDRLGLNLQRTADSYLSLSAATRGTTLEGEQTRVIFEAISGAMGLLGKSSADTEGALLAVQQIVSKGIVSMEELRQQLGERLPGAFQIAADSMGLTTRELNDLVASGNLTAEEFLPKFARGIEEAFGNLGRVDSFSAAINRLQNALTEASITVGDAGAFNILTKTIEGITATALGAVGAFEVFVSGIVLLKQAVTQGISADEFFGGLDEAAQRAASRVRGATEDFFSLNNASQETRDSIANVAAAADELPGAFERSIKEIGGLAAAAEQTNKLLKEIGIDPKQLEEPIEKAILAFNQLSQLDGVSGEDLFSGLLVTLDKLNSTDFLAPLAASLATAFEEGRISADDLQQSYGALLARGQDLSGAASSWGQSFEAQAQSLQKSTAETKKAEEQAQKTALELEKIASNERIKNIEARVTLDVASIEAQSEEAVAAINNIGTAIESTGELLGGLFDNRLDADSWEERRIIEEGIRKEQESREDLLKRQNKLINAQIAKLRAQTRMIQDGGALINVNGDGLAPHLEAIMYSLFEAIQVRVNEEGYKFLLEAA